MSKGRGEEVMSGDEKGQNNAYLLRLPVLSEQCLVP